MLTDKNIVDSKATLGLYLFKQTNEGGFVVFFFLCMDFRHAADCFLLFVCVSFLHHVLAFHSGLKSSEQKARNSPTMNYGSEQNSFHQIYSTKRQKYLKSNFGTDLYLLCPKHCLVHNEFS